MKLQGIKIDVGIQMMTMQSFGLITENRNGDIILSGIGMKAVVGMDNSGGRRFTYPHPEYTISMSM